MEESETEATLVQIYKKNNNILYTPMYGSFVSVQPDKSRQMLNCQRKAFK